MNYKQGVIITLREGDGMSKANRETNKKNRIVLVPSVSREASKEGKASMVEDPLLVLEEILESDKEFLRIIDDKSDRISIGLRVIIMHMEHCLNDKISISSTTSINKSMLESSMRLLKMAKEEGLEKELEEVETRLLNAARMGNISIDEIYEKINMK